MGIYKPQHSSVIDIGTHYTAMYRQKNEKDIKMNIGATDEETPSILVNMSGFNHGDAVCNNEHNV